MQAEKAAKEEAAGLMEQLAAARSLNETTKLSAQNVRFQLEAAKVGARA